MMVMVCSPGLNGVVGWNVHEPLAFVVTFVLIFSSEWIMICTVAFGAAVPLNSGFASINVSLFFGVMSFGSTPCSLTAGCGNCTVAEELAAADAEAIGSVLMVKS